MADATFTRRTVPALRRPVFRLGLACNYGIDAPGFARALERGMDYVFWTSARPGHRLHRRAPPLLAWGPARRGPRGRSTRSPDEDRWMREFGRAVHG